LLGSGLPQGVSVFPVGQRHLRGIDEPEQVFEVAIDGLELEDVEPAPAAAEPSMPVAPVPPSPTGGGLDRDIARRFEDLGTRLAAGIQERILRSFDEKTGRADSPSSVDDIAARMESLGDEIDARVRAALARKGLDNDADRGEP
jgi:hypothetical protein